MTRQEAREKKGKRIVLGVGWTRYQLCLGRWDRAEHVRLYANKLRWDLVPLKIQPFDNGPWRLILEPVVPQRKAQRGRKKY